MGAGTKEHTLLDLVRSGDSQSALKILFKHRPNNTRQQQGSSTESPNSKSNSSK